MSVCEAHRMFSIAEFGVGVLYQYTQAVLSVCMRVRTGQFQAFLSSVDLLFYFCGLLFILTPFNCIYLPASLDTYYVLFVCLFII